MRWLGILIVLAAFGTAGGVVMTGNLGDPDHASPGALRHLKQGLDWLSGVVGQQAAGGLVMALGAFLALWLWRRTGRRR